MSSMGKPGPLSPGARPADMMSGLGACETASDAPTFPLPMPVSFKMIPGLGRGTSQRLARKVRARAELRELDACW